MYIIDETIPRSLRSFMSTFLQVVSIVVVISFSTPLFMAIILPMGLVYYYIQRFYVASSRQLKRLESVSRSPIYAHFSETLNGVSSIRAYRSEQTFMDENEYKINYNLQAYYPSVSANRWLALRLEFMGNLIVFFAALFVVVESESKKSTIDPGTVGLSLSYAMSVTQTLNWMVRMSSDLETNIVAIERVEEYCQIDMEAAPVTKIRPAKGWPVNGDIDFDNYSVRYREGLDLVLRGISVQIKGGQKVW
jgi:ABC-type multidrug transport system fused ATPase/permease subunit